MRTKQVVVVGAGPGGLAAAMLMAARGFRVKLFERLPHIGGRTSTLEAHGCKWDLGPTFFLYPQVLEEIFQACGRELRDEVELKRLDPQYRVIFGAGGKLDATPDVARMEQEIARLCPRDAQSFSRFLADNRAKLRTFQPILARSFGGLRDCLSGDMLRSIGHLNPHLSLDGYLKRFFSDERVRLAFSFQSKYLGMSPFRCPSLFSILSFLEYEYGVFHPIGGCGAITAAMARVAEEAGVEIHLDEPVESVVFEGRRAKGVRTRSGTHRADALVVNADFARFMSRVIPDPMRSRWTRSSARTEAFLLLHLHALSRGGRPLRAAAPFHLHSPRITSGTLTKSKTATSFPTDPSCYVQNACVTDPSSRRMIAARFTCSRQ